MVYVRKARKTVRTVHRRRPYRRGRQSIRRRRAVRPVRLPRKTLGSGIQYHKTLYGEDVVMNQAFVPAYSFDTMVRNIPKYNPGTVRSYNIQQARIRDKLYVKGIKFRICAYNTDTADHAVLRAIFIRNDSWDENLAPFSNCFIDNDGATAVASAISSQLITQRFNLNLCRNRKKDLFFDKVLTFNPNTALNAGIVNRRSFYVPINQLAVFEEKGSAGESDDLKTGRYILLLFYANADGSSSADLKITWSADVVWCEN